MSLTFYFFGHFPVVHFVPTINGNSLSYSGKYYGHFPEKKKTLKKSNLLNEHTYLKTKNHKARTKNLHSASS